MLLLPSKFLNFFFLYFARSCPIALTLLPKLPALNSLSDERKIRQRQKDKNRKWKWAKKKKKLLCHLRCWKTRTLFRAKHRVLLNLALGTMRNRLSRPRSTGCTRATWQVAQRCGKNQTDQQLYRATDSRGAHFWQPLHLSAPTWRLNASHVTVKKAKFFNHSRFS